MRMDIVNVNGVNLNADRDMVVKRFRSRGEFEPQSMELWRGYARDGGMMLDIGAYTGIYAIASAQEGARVTAFEPMPKCAARMRENAYLNGVSFQWWQNAVSDNGGRLTMSSRADLSSASQVDLRGLPVHATILDDMAFTDVRAIKIDVEGHEQAVLRGAMDTISRCRPAIIAECWTADDFAAVCAMLLGYSGRRIEGSNYLMTHD